MLILASSSWCTAALQAHPIGFATLSLTQAPLFLLLFPTFRSPSQSHISQLFGPAGLFISFFFFKVHEGNPSMRCRSLFNKALLRVPQKMVVVVLEECLMDPAEWLSLAASLGSRPFVPLYHKSQLQQAVPSVAHEISRVPAVPSPITASTDRSIAGSTQPPLLHDDQLILDQAMVKRLGLMMRDSRRRSGRAADSAGDRTASNAGPMPTVRPARLYQPDGTASPLSDNSNLNLDGPGEPSGSSSATLAALLRHRARIQSTEAAAASLASATSPGTPAYHLGQPDWTERPTFVPASALVSSPNTQGQPATAAAAAAAASNNYRAAAASSNNYRAAATGPAFAAGAVSSAAPLQSRATALPTTMGPTVRFNRQSVSETVNILQQHAQNVMAVAQACITLRDLTVSSDANRLEVTSRGGIEAILARMHDHNSQPRLLENACRAIINLAVNDSVESAIVAQGGVHAIVAAMQSHPGDVGVQTQGAWALRNLSFALRNKLAVARGGGIGAVLAAMRAHPNVSEVQEHGLWALRNLSAADELKSAISEANGIETALSAMKRHLQHGGVQKQGCGALANLAADAYNRSHIGQIGGIEIILEAMASHITDSEVQVQAAWSLKNLSFNGPANRATVARLRGVDVILAAMRAHPDHPGVQEQSMRALWNLSFENADNRKAIANADGRQLIELAAIRHSNVPAVVEAATGALGNLEEGAVNAQS